MATNTEKAKQFRLELEKSNRIFKLQENANKTNNSYSMLNVFHQNRNTNAFKVSVIESIENYNPSSYYSINADKNAKIKAKAKVDELVSQFSFMGEYQYTSGNETIEYRKLIKDTNPSRQYLIIIRNNNTGEYSYYHLHLTESVGVTGDIFLDAENKLKYIENNKFENWGENQLSGTVWVHGKDDYDYAEVPVSVGPAFKHILLTKRIKKPNNEFGGSLKARKGSYESMTLKELIMRAKKRKIAFSGKNKAQLIESLRK